MIQYNINTSIQQLILFINKYFCLQNQQTMPILVPSQSYCSTTFPDLYIIFTPISKPQQTKQINNKYIYFKKISTISINPIKNMIITITTPTSPTPQQYTYPNQKIKLLLGRNPKSTQYQCIIIQQPSASRTHLTIKFKNKKIKIMDMNSSNGTKVNNKQIESNQWIEIHDTDDIILGYSETKIVLKLAQNQPNPINNYNSSSNLSRSPSRSRQKNKTHTIDSLCQKFKISGSSLKMLKQMTMENKSREQKIKFLKLMGCKNLEQYWEDIQQCLKQQNKYSNIMKNTTQELAKQFQSSRVTHWRKGLGCY